mmetsp:Transcript_56247/g.159671  ORF Transcript_56247/g.159671 Transcript_56247/m.159671 type:complete len:203 (-) Transcript_56247:175-783(-)
MVALGRDHLGAPANAAYHLCEEVLERGLVTLLAVHRDRCPLVLQQRVHEPVGEERERVDAARTGVDRGATRLDRRRRSPRPLARVHHTVHLHGDHECIKITHDVSGEAKLVANLVEELHEDPPLALTDVQVLVRLVHISSCVLLGPSGQVAHDLHYQKLESAALGLLVPRCDRLVGIQRRVRHPLVHAPIHESGNAKHASTL